MLLDMTDLLTLIWILSFLSSGVVWYEKKNQILQFENCATGTLIAYLGGKDLNFLNFKISTVRNFFSGMCDR